MTEPASPAPHDPAREFAADSLVVSLGRPPHALDEPVNPPIVLSSTFHGLGGPGEGEKGYGRFTNPTWDPLEEALGTLEASDLPGLLYASGMGAIAAAMSLMPLNATLVMPRHSYSGSLSIVKDLETRAALTVRHADIADTGATLELLDGADMLWVESPTNPMLEVADLPALIAAAKERGILTVVDNTFCTPLLQQPLSVGADVVVHSATKYLGGHSDVIMGAVVTGREDLREKLHAYRTLHGAIPGPFETWLTLRGLRTLAVRTERSQATAHILAERLAGHPAVARVRYPGLAADPGHQRAREQMRGFGSVVSFEVDPAFAAAPAGSGEAADAVMAALRFWTPATSLGGVESLAERRRRHAAEPESVPADLIRLSVGIENAEDLWADLEQALDAARAAGAAAGATS
ncbi:trans-sulfuration enzyme family protein [Zhihengliuella salsuginis]|uniref:Cystathionine gamma-synthase n=1 Tax=Zhihengliuella salsuginis TaxID=578222 RepID=A0ABQ3GKN5_9MICC|nr:aminotransferase class I/II-fold pyridoxal phosphate-dependent enzyme [Zhihengliuella salsuginis]GHD12887.1 cystathionine gamma-synthase [Zhihengliuella salsuginis]